MIDRMRNRFCYHVHPVNPVKKILIMNDSLTEQVIGAAFKVHNQLVLMFVRWFRRARMLLIFSSKAGRRMDLHPAD